MALRKPPAPPRRAASLLRTHRPRAPKRVRRSNKPVARNRRRVSNRKGTEMTIPSFSKKLAVPAVVFALALFAAPQLSAQGGSYPAPQQPPAQPADKSAAPAAPAAPKVDPAEEADYKTFFELKPEENDKRIDLGETFVLKYPNSKYTEGVYSQLANAEYAKQNFPKMYADADKALALNPDDPTLLVLIGWVIPHQYNPNDANSDAQLDKAEK